MKTICSFLMMFVLSLVIGQHVWADAPYGDFTLAASHSSSTNAEHALSPALSPANAWHIQATTTYKGSPTDASWGSRLFFAYYGVGDNAVTEFYQRQNAGGDLRTLRIANRRITPEVVKQTYVDTDPGTVFGFDVISTGSAIYSAVTADGVTYARKYTVGADFTKVQAASNYDVTGTISQAYLPTIITLLDDYPTSGSSNLPKFSIPAGITVKKIVPVVAFGLTTDITLSIEGDDASFFDVTSTLSVAEGTETPIEISFSPQETRNYTAILKLSSTGAEDKFIPLTGAGINLTLPFKISDENETHWYFIQFDRYEKVFDGTGSNVLLASLSDDDNLKWKIVGSWDAYRFVNKVTGLEIASNSTDIPPMVAAGSGDIHAIYQHTSGDWRLYNIVKGQNYNEQTKGSGTTVGFWSTNSTYPNDAGNRLRFILVDEPAINTVQQLSYGTLYTNANGVLNLPVSGVLLNTDITCTLDGADADYFTVSSGTLPAAGGTLKVTFTPVTGKTDYSATITLSGGGAEPVVVPLTGSLSDLPLPFKVSSEDTSNEHWYFIKFNATNKVFQGTAVGENLPQAAQADDNNLKWKFVGDWDAYKIVNKATGLEIGSDGTGLAIMAAAGNGNTYSLYEHPNGNWALLNNQKNNNFNNNAGTKVGLYSGKESTDDGNRLIFILTDEPVINTNSQQLEFGKWFTGITKTLDLDVSGTLLTSEVTCVLGGDDAANFTISSEQLPVTGGKLQVNFTPTTANTNYSATITLTSNSVEPVVVALTGSAVDLPFTVSNETNEYWYYIEFNRQLNNKKAVQYKPAGTNVAQALLDSLNADFQWKIVGTFDDYRFVARNGGELYLTTSATKRYQVKTDENGDSHKLLFHNAGDYQLYNNTSSDGNYRYIDDNNGSALGLYNANTDGNRLKFTFIPPFFTVDNATLDFDEVKINTTAENFVTITTTNVSEAITATLSGTAAAIYSFAAESALATTTVPAAGGELKVYFKPTVIAETNAASIELTQGACSSTITLTGKAIKGGTDIASAASDEAPVAVRYYNLFGVQVDQPASSGIYLVEKVYATGKTKVSKVLVAVK